MNESTKNYSQGFGALLSYVIGWAYFLAWSASFYPQAILNWRRKSVQGLSIDFIYLNVLGFLCYSLFNLAFYFSSEVQEEYKRRNNGQENLVRANDVLFAVHALALSAFTFFQTFVYKRDQGQKASVPTKLFIAGTVTGTLSVAGLVLWSNDSAPRSYEWIDLLYYLSYVKLSISIIKYCPQAYINWKVQSTVGWSIHNILLDFTGGTLSISQLILDAYLSDDWSGISGDPAKFGLGFVSIAFDLVFMTQHYILYRDRTDIYSGESMGDTKSQDSQHSSQLEEQQSLLGHSSPSRYTNARDKGDLEEGAH